MKGFFVLLASLSVSLLLAVPAFGFGPKADTSETTADPAVIACAGEGGAYEDGVVARQSEREVQAGGGPKSDAVAPANCDHYWQGREEGEVIGNGWPPPPFAAP